MPSSVTTSTKHALRRCTWAPGLPYGVVSRIGRMSTILIASAPSGAAHDSADRSTVPLPARCLRSGARLAPSADAYDRTRGRPAPFVANRELTPPVSRAGMHAAAPRRHERRRNGSCAWTGGIRARGRCVLAEARTPAPLARARGDLLPRARLARGGHLRRSGLP